MEMIYSLEGCWAHERRISIKARLWDLLFLFCFLGGWSFFRATPKAYGGSQDRGQIRRCQPQPQPCRIQGTSGTYTTAQSNTRSLTHRAKPGIEPTSSRILVRFISTAPWWELWLLLILRLKSDLCSFLLPSCDPFNSLFSFLLSVCNFAFSSLFSSGYERGVHHQNMHKEMQSLTSRLGHF